METSSIPIAIPLAGRSNSSSHGGGGSGSTSFVETRATPRTQSHDRHGYSSLEEGDLVGDGDHETANTHARQQQQYTTPMMSANEGATDSSSTSSLVLGTTLPTSNGRLRDAIDGKISSSFKGPFSNPVDATSGTKSVTAASSVSSRVDPSVPRTASNGSASSPARRPIFSGSTQTKYGHYNTCTPSTSASKRQSNSDHVPQNCIHAQTNQPNSLWSTSSSSSHGAAGQHSQVLLSPPPGEASSTAATPTTTTTTAPPKPSDTLYLFGVTPSPYAVAPHQKLGGHDDDDDNALFLSPLTSPLEHARTLVQATQEAPRGANTNGNGRHSCGSGGLLRNSSQRGTRSTMDGNSGNRSSSSNFHRTVLGRTRVTETRHAQSLLLGLAFCAVWSPSNLMAPNLTLMAQDLGFRPDDTVARDLYLGSVAALVVGVASLPVAGAIGVYTDLCASRKWLFCATVLGGATGTVLTAMAHSTHSYAHLLLARWLTGGCMAGSVPTAFSFLGDLFDVHERNTASSGLTALMGLGIISGQVYAGRTGGDYGWAHAFVVSAVVQVILCVLCAWLVRDPVRGGREKVLQDMLKAGTRYERTLTWNAFVHAVRNNASNGILLWQGFFSSLPWGVIFVFLNDYLSQERGFSVPDATFLVAVFGVGCAAGGILGGYIGQHVMQLNRSYLPLFMAVTTILGILPFLVLLNSSFANARSLRAISCAALGGLIASLPAVNVRPCLLNVNPPESRGASLTAANLLISLGRGVGPTCLTLIQTTCHVDRRVAFNVTMITFWVVAGIQLLLLMKTLPLDQDAMEAELESYAQNAIANHQCNARRDSSSIISIEERMNAFDSTAAKETFAYMQAGIKELRNPFLCLDGAESSNGWSHPGSDVDSGDDRMDTIDDDNEDEAAVRRDLWIRQEGLLAPEDPLGSPRNPDLPTETTPILGKTNTYH